MGSNVRTWVGRVMTGFAVAFLLFDGGSKVLGLVPLEEGNEALLGFKLSALPLIGWLLLVSTAIHLVPRLSLLGAILLTGYFGGAVACHIRLENPLFTHVLSSVYAATLIWGGLLLRRPEIRLILPSRRAEERAGFAGGSLTATRS